MTTETAEFSTAISVATPSQRAALALNTSQTEAHLLALATKHAGITEIKDQAGRQQAHGAAMELSRARIQVERVAKDARDDATKFSKAVIAEEKRLTAIIEVEEARLKGLRDAWDAEQERIKRERAEAERQRVMAITERISEIKGYASLAMQCRTAERVQSLIDKLTAYNLTGFDEFAADADLAYDATLKAMSEQRQVLTEREAEAARLKAEREELARQQAKALQEQEAREAAQRAEAEKLAAERAELERLRADLQATRVAIASEPEKEKPSAPMNDAPQAMVVQAMVDVIMEDLAPAAPEAPAAAALDDGDRLTLGQINERLAPVSISVAGLQQLGFEPVAQVKASRLYRACDLPAMGEAIARHAIKATA